MVVIFRRGSELIRLRRLAIDDQVLQPVQTAATGTNQIDIAIAVKVDRFGIEAKADSSAGIDERPLPAPRRSIESIRIDPEWVVLAGILPVVPQVSFAGNDFLVSIVVEVGHQEAVRLGPTGVDDMPQPTALRTVPLLLQPVHTDVVAASPDQVAVPVTIHVEDENRNAAVTMEFPFGVKHPATGVTVTGSLGPAVLSDQIAASVAVDISETDPMPSQLGRQVMANPPRWRGILDPISLAGIPTRRQT